MAKKRKIVDPRVCAVSCEYVLVDMVYPRTKSQAEDFLWYVYHEGVELCIDRDGEWSILVPDKCRYLSGDRRCFVGNRQPEICARYSPDGAEKLDDVIRERFRNEHEFLAYLKKKRPALFEKMDQETRKQADLPPASRKPGRKKAKKNVSSGTSGCTECEAACCNYLNIELERPDSEEELNTILWYMYHEGTEIYIGTDRKWSLVFHNECIHVDENNLCSIYSRRPAICRKFSDEGCHGNDFDESVKYHFRTEKSLMAYVRKKRPAFFKKLGAPLRKLAR